MMERITPCFVAMKGFWTCYMLWPSMPPSNVEYELSPNNKREKQLERAMTVADM